MTHKHGDTRLYTAYAVANCLATALEEHEPFEQLTPIVAAVVRGDEAWMDLEMNYTTPIALLWSMFYNQTRFSATGPIHCSHWAEQEQVFQMLEGAWDCEIECVEEDPTVSWSKRGFAGQFADCLCESSELISECLSLRMQTMENLTKPEVLPGCMDINTEDGNSIVFRLTDRSKIRVQRFTHQSELVRLVVTVVDEAEDEPDAPTLFTQNSRSMLVIEE